MPACSFTRSPALVCAILLGALALVGCHGSGGGGGTTVPISTPGTGSQLYVSGNAGHRLFIYNDANTVSGSASPNRAVAGGRTTLLGPRGIAVDMARNQIYIANALNDSILVSHNARSATGGDAPDRMITGAPLDRPSELFMDVVNDRLYVSSTNDHSILIYLPDGDSSRLIEQPLKTADIQKSIAKASDNLRFGAAVAAFGQVLRGGTYTNDFGYDDIVKLAQGTLSQDAFGYRGEFVTLVNLAKSLDGTNRQAKR